MSGGSMEYLYDKVLDASFQEKTIERKAFRLHLVKVAAALKAIEWNDSGDGAEGEAELIRACIGDKAVLQEMITEAKILIQKLQKEIGRN